MVDELVEKFINNSLDKFREWLEENLKSDKKIYEDRNKDQACQVLIGRAGSGDTRKDGQDKTQLALFGVLQRCGGNKLVYDGKEVNARCLMEMLASFADKNVGFMIDAQFKQFYSLLPLLSIMEEGGVEEVNVYIGKLFSEYKETGANMTEKEMNDKIKAINDVLFGAIYLFPHLVKSVEVKLLPDKIVEAEKFIDKHEYHYGKDRRIYDVLRKAAPEKSEVITLPLPYFFTTGTHGSGERSAMGASRAEVHMTYIHLRNNFGIRIPAIALAICRPILYLDYIYFTLDEVDNIKFSDNGEFMPFCDADYEGRIEYISKWNYALHYLIFRGFANYVHFRKREDFGDVTDSHWIEVEENLYEPEFGSGLWNEKWGNILGVFGKQTLESGFLAIKFSDPENMRLMEFNNIKLPSDDNHIAAAKLIFRILQNDKNTQKLVKKFAGNKIIERLFVIPVRERRF